MRIHCSHTANFLDQEGVIEKCFTRGFFMEFRGQERQFAETLAPLLQYQRTKVPVNCHFSGLLSISKQMEGKRSKRHKSGKEKRKKSVPRSWEK